MIRSIMMIFLLAAMAKAEAQTVIYDENAEVRSVGNFSAIEVSGTVMLYLSQSNETGVVVSAGDAKYNSKIKTEVSDGVLRITVDGGMWNTFSLSNMKLKAYVSVPVLNELNVSGASYVNINAILKTPVLKLQVNGASELKGNIEVGTLSMTINGASVARLAGVVSQGVIDANGASKMDSYDLSFETLKVNTNGASSIKVTVNKELNAAASGGSTVYYKGNVSNVNANAVGGSHVRKQSSGSN